jgi:hypothetical protein
MAVDEVTINFEEGKVIFWKYIPESMRDGIKICKLCGRYGHTV